MAVRILFFKEGVCDYNPEDLKGRDMHGITLKLFPVMRISTDNESFVFQMTAKFFSEETSILNYGFVLSMKVDGWIPVSDMDIENMKDENDTESYLKRLLASRASVILKEISSAVISFTRGAIAARSWTNEVQALIMPEIDIDSFVPAIRYTILGK